MPPPLLNGRFLVVTGSSPADILSINIYLSKIVILT